MSQLYLYGTYQRYENLAETKKKIMAILNQEKKKVDPKAVAQWIHEKIEKREINIQFRKRVMSVNPENNRSEKGERKL